MAKKMLIDASHAEETRVVVLDGQRVEEFDFESINKKQLAGNIYLAKVMRVEPSLQAAFVDYGGNRHGFLPFSEIHPDYYQIPHADREALLAQEAAEQARENSEDDSDGDDKGGADPRGGNRKRGARRGGKDRRGGGGSRSPSRSRGARNALVEREFRISGGVKVRLSKLEAGPDGDYEVEREFELEDGTPVTLSRSTADARPASRDAMAERADLDDKITDAPEADDEAPEAVGGDDAREEARENVRPRKIRMRDYKIQEVIKKRQILLIQVVKEERGTKGAAVTTYLSLAGRYCVLMPNTARGGGISRKITNVTDRKKLKEIAGEMEVPTGMGLIIRTAGSQRTRSEIKRDYEYLLRQWETVRELTLKSVAPTLVFEEGDLIKRSIRDLYTKDIESVLVEGEDGYREAKDFMKMLMPSHAKNVQPYREDTPLFIRHQVENHLAAMFNPTVQLRSGGYIVIGVTEALVAIDVNSGRSTREHSIEETAVKTNLEAADEVARQLRLRDLAGLIVIDFIDMEDNRNNRAVEKRMKDKLATDRARLQIGRISSFGLMEMSRQRLRPGMVEASTKPCPHCHGSGLVRSDDSLSLSILRDVEEEGVRDRATHITVSAPVDISNFLLNHKRDRIASIEQRYGMQVIIEGVPTLISPEYKLDWLKDENAPVRQRAAIRIDSAFTDVEPEEDEVVEEAEAPAAAAPQNATEANGEDDDDKSRRRGKRGGRRRRKEEDPMPVIDLEGEAGANEPKPFSYADDGAKKGNERRSSRGGRGRGKRGDGGRRDHGKLAANAMLSRPDALDASMDQVFGDTVSEQDETPPQDVEVTVQIEAVETDSAETVDAVVHITPEPVEAASEEQGEQQQDEAPQETAAPQPAEEAAPGAEPEAQTEPEEQPVLAGTMSFEPTPAPEPEKPSRPKRAGWWSRSKS